MMRVGFDGRRPLPDGTVQNKTADYKYANERVVFETLLRHDFGKHLRTFMMVMVLVIMPVIMIVIMIVVMIVIMQGVVMVVRV